ncbi:ankyrin repeat and IBR domain-containing protein 1 isoform X1 [Ornithorhynchus anatinus]|uniref:Ankyrin repeat and IBR domain-containing protein 1 n=1 Tax=Ornithorhynchus anatinus TaxID=9258 RepID=A0A6I8NY97_ORNAN|nr:ankyrin repeat and IBR domain-containing protein 1 isoform X1 [Ornithorhynchus anatinus]XP_028926423.1 ankyrin repeat and IBR domain-containing protein 1 isoform X1 [Ornithorhynchus anatinus]
MGNTTTKFRKALINGDENLACQIYESNPQLKESLDPNTSYGEPYQHNTPLHYAARHGMNRILGTFLFMRDGNPNKRNVHNETSMHLLCMGPELLISEGALHPRLARPSEDHCRRADCLQMILRWKGAKLDRGEYERAAIDAVDNKKNTPLHYAAGSGMRACVELLVKHGGDLFAENENKDTPCDCAEKQHHTDLALNLESQMVFSRDPEADDIEAEYAALDKREPYEGLRPQDLRRLKDMLIVESADMLQAPLFTAEALLRAHDWDREKLLEAWMANPENCCQRSGVQMPTPPPSGYNAWDTLPSPRTPRTTRSSVTSPDEISLSPGDLDAALCEICMCNISVFEDPVDMPCGHDFCRACWEAFLNLKIQEGEAHNIFCPAYECFQLVPVEVIESVVSREMDKRYLQFDIKAFVENNPAIKWCPTAGCERAVRLTQQGSGIAGSDTLSFPLLSAPAVDCGKGHLFCWECLGEAHEPCDCQTWKNWLQKITEMKPEELVGVSEAYEDAANCLWLLTNSKPCANCKSPIQKNEGCNHMQCAKCKYDFCWICLEEWKKHSSSTGGYYRCTRYQVIQHVEEQSKEMTVEAEKKHRRFQELDRFMHYYTRFKNHELSYQLEQRLLKTAKEKMEQLSRALRGTEGVCPDTTFIEDAVQELLKTRRILKCSYPYGFFLEPKSTKKEIFELMQTDLEMVTEDLAQKVNRPYLRTPRHKIIRAACLVQQKRQEFLASVARGVAPADSPEAPRRSFAGGTWDWEYLGFASPEEYAEFQYRRRHRQRRRGDVHSLLSNTPDPDEPSESTLESQEGGSSRRPGTSMVSSASVSVLHSSSLHDYTPASRSENQDSLQALSSLDEDDPNILLAIQLSLQDSGLAMDEEAGDFLRPDAAFGATGTSLPTRLEAGPGAPAHPRPALSSSELLELGESLLRLGAAGDPFSAGDREPRPSDGPDPEAGGADPSDRDPGPNADLLGNIMAWFHDMNPQSIALIPSAAAAEPGRDPPGPEGGTAAGPEEEEKEEEEEGRETVTRAEEVEEVGPALREERAPFEGAGGGSPAEESGPGDGAGPGEAGPRTGDRATAGAADRTDPVGGLAGQTPQTSPGWTEQVHLV